MAEADERLDCLMLLARYEQLDDRDRRILDCWAAQLGPGAGPTASDGRLPPEPSGLLRLSQKHRMALFRAIIEAARSAGKDAERTRRLLERLAAILKLPEPGIPNLLAGSCLPTDGSDSSTGGASSGHPEPFVLKDDPGRKKRGRSDWLEALDEVPLPIWMHVLLFPIHLVGFIIWGLAVVAPTMGGSGEGGPLLIRTWGQLLGLALILGYGLLWLGILGGGGWACYWFLVRP